MAAVSGLLAWFSVHRANRIQHNIENPNEIDCTICPVEDPDKERAWRHRARVFEVASFVGLGAAAAGATWLVFRLRKRNAHREEIRELQLRRRALTSIRLGAGADMGGLTLSLSGRF